MILFERFRLPLISLLIASLLVSCTSIGTPNLVTDFSSRDASGLVHAVIEIPAGTNAKCEVEKEHGQLLWEIKSGKPRVVQYLPYPGNYGMIPQTILPRALGGDGDPLDVIVLGPALERGVVVPVRVIGVLELLDGGEQDDKLMAVSLDGPFRDVRDLSDLDARFAGVRLIVETWFSNYKGPGKMETRGWGNAERAEKILRAAERAFSE